MSGSIRLLFATALPVVLVGQATKPELCDAPAALWEEVLSATTRVRYEVGGKRRPAEEVTKERREKITALLAKYPDEFFVRRAYLAHTKEGVASEQTIAEFKKYADEHPANAGARYLHAEALIGRRTPEAIGILDELAAKEPPFPWTYRSLAQIYQSPRFSDRPKAKQYAQAFVDRCPDSNISASLARNLDNSPSLDAFAQRLRARLAGKKDSESVKTLESLWRLEFKITPAPEHDRIRARVRDDLKFIESLEGEALRDVQYVLEQGYDLTGDKAAIARMNAAAKTEQELMSAFFKANEERQKTDPFVPPTAGKEERVAYLRRTLEYTNAWVAKLPNEQFLAQLRLDYLAELEDTQDSEVVAEGRRAVDLARKSVQSVFGPSSTFASVALAWAKRGVELGEIPALIKESEEAAAKREKAEETYDQSDLYASPEDGLRRESGRWRRNNGHWEALALAYAKSDRGAEARGVMSKWEAGLEERRKRVAEIRAKREKEAAPAADAKPDPVRNFEDGLVKNIGHEEARYRHVLADIARAEKRNLDALALYQSAARALPEADAANSESVRKARELWKQAGGTNEGWQAWMDSARPAEAGKQNDGAKWSKMRRALPDLSVADRGGQTWTLAKVKGKTTLVNVWATWCGPCRAELPHLQKLHDRIKSREDVQVITFNVDDNTGLVEPYMKENQFSFPVLFAKEYVDALVGPLGIPTNWIADRAATLRAEAVGFSGDGERWIKETLAEVERIRETVGEPK